MRHELVGVIAGAGFASGDRVVIGHWTSSPVGPMTDVMWAASDGRRVLFAPAQRAADFISAIYTFDHVEVVDVAAAGGPGSLDVSFAHREVHLRTGRGWRIPFRRPPWSTRLVEAPVARALHGVRTYGISSTGVREWYRVDGWRSVVSGRASVAGRDLGALGPVDPPCRFGFSEPPRRPTITAVRPLLEDPSGALDQVVERSR